MPDTTAWVGCRGAGLGGRAALGGVPGAGLGGTLGLAWGGYPGAGLGGLGGRGSPSG